MKIEVLSVIFQSPESGYVVLRARGTDSGVAPGAASGAGDPEEIVATGPLGRTIPGETLEVQGRWVTHPRFGRQFEIAAFDRLAPASLAGVIRYLSSGLVKGIGPKTAEKIVEKFGEQTLEVLEKTPKKLLDVRGITKAKLADIVSAWESQREIRNLMLFLQSHEVSPVLATKVYRQYGEGALEKVRENPYQLAQDVRGVGFRTADAMAAKLGMEPGDPRRIEAAHLFLLMSASEQGHLFLPRETLLHRAAELLGDVDGESVAEGIEGLRLKKKVVVEEEAVPDPKGTSEADAAVFLRQFHRMERDCAARLHALATHPRKADRAGAAARVREAERDAAIQLSSEQREAAEAMTFEKFLVVTGGPGTGKTTITRVAVAAMKRAGMKVRLAAPTGRAAKRLSDASGHAAMTLHRLLEYNPDGGFGRNEETKLKTDVLLIDEASMLDAQLFQAVLRAMPLTARLILVGDADQLPSVGPGNVLGDVLASEVAASVRLTRIYRQAEASMIVQNAHRVSRGEFPVDAQAQAPEADFFWVRQDDPARVQEMVLQLVTERIPKMYGLDPRTEIQTLTPMHKGEVGTAALNELLQARINPPRPDRPEMKRGQTVFRQGDRVFQTRNNYEKDVYNGDLGVITRVDAQEGEMLVDFDGRHARYERGELDELSLAYCMSVHKSQGSEYPAVVAPILTQHFMLLQRNLIYTALTRAKKLAVIIGPPRALAMGLKNDKAHKRWTMLARRLQERFNAG